MKNHPRISELLVETGAYRDLDEPVILASGQLGIFYVNTEKLCQDGGEFNRYGNDSWAMIEHALKMTDEHPTFNEVIDILTGRVRAEMIDSEGFSNRATTLISGGQRRDWLFSGPVAKKLNLSHLSLYKGGKTELISFLEGNPVEIMGAVEDLDNYDSFHLSDLLTEGSSAYRNNNWVEAGWIPWQRKKGININNLATVVTRLQGGEENLKGRGVQTHAFVAIDEDFLREYSGNAEVAIDYTKDPTAWSTSYLQENGALALVGSFDPEGGKLDKARKFIDRYGSVLRESGKLPELEGEVERKYSVTLGELVEKE